jgi:hypothetical protein
MSEHTKETHEIRERIARVEQKVEDYVAQGDMRLRHMERIEEKLDVLEADLSRYRGLVGGVLLVVTAVVSFFRIFWESILEFFGR